MNGEKSWLVELLAQAGMAGSIAHWAIVIILIGAVDLGIMSVVLRQMGVSIPPFIITIFWITVACFVGIRRD